jgi:di/tricarboxylate transporter
MAWGLSEHLPSVVEFGCANYCSTVLCAGVPVFEEPEKQNCLALLGFASLLWCTEALPLYVTSMLVPLLAVVLRVMVDQTADPPARKSAPDAADAIFKSMFSQVCSAWLHMQEEVADDMASVLSMLGEWVHLN